MWKQCMSASSMWSLFLELAVLPSIYGNSFNRWNSIEIFFKSFDFDSGLMILVLHAVNY